ncbi:hypothetical protein NPX13_g10258 [Xylaria arbuscula]|uniref:Uncharacterized protein n=1 Tax=Xylaria arbuscula TaxID=114810 RepID=A0A9W8N4W7_9PEZI|nr:hypothetical protein NPX13_g10258 [Xylaria arbuscula]
MSLPSEAGYPIIELYGSALGKIDAEGAGNATSSEFRSVANRNYVNRVSGSGNGGAEKRRRQQLAQAKEGN